MTMCELCGVREAEGTITDYDDDGMLSAWGPDCCEPCARGMGADIEDDDTESSYEV